MDSKFNCFYDWFLGGYLILNRKSFIQFHSHFKLKARATSIHLLGKAKLLTRDLAIRVLEEGDLVGFDYRVWGSPNCSFCTWNVSGRQPMGKI